MSRETHHIVGTDILLLFSGGLKGVKLANEAFVSCLVRGDGGAVSGRGHYLAVLELTVLPVSL